MFSLQANPVCVPGSTFAPLFFIHFVLYLLRPNGVKQQRRIKKIWRRPGPNSRITYKLVRRLRFNHAYYTTKVAQVTFTNNSSQNRRQTPRYELPLNVFTDEGVGNSEALVNISLSGCCIHTPVSYTSGDHVLLHFASTQDYFPHETTFCLDGQIVWKKQSGKRGFVYGMQFPEDESSEFFQNERSIFTELLRSLASIK